MRLSHKSIYGLRAMFDLAYHSGQGPLQLREIAAREEIPERFLEQIFGDLKRAELVVSKRGPKGGYQLSCEPAEVSLRAIFAALDGLPQVPEALRESSEQVVEGASGEREASRGVRSREVSDGVCEELVEHVLSFLGQMSLADLMERGERMGVGRECYERFVYVI